MEADIASRTLYLSTHLLELLNMPIDKQYITIEEIMQYIENPEQIQKDARAIWNTEGIHQVAFKHKLYTTGLLNFRWYMSGESKMIGTVFPA